MKIPPQDTRISRLISDKLVPWANSMHLQWMTATKHRRELQLCESVKMIPRKIIDTKNAGSGPRRYRNSSVMIKHWKKDHLMAANSFRAVCVLSGCADFQFWDYELRVPEGTFILIPPNIPQPSGSRSHLNNDNPIGYCDICWMQAAGDELHFWVCRSEGEEHGTSQWNNVLFQNQRLNLFLQLLHEEVLVEGESKLSLVPHLLQLLSAALQRDAVRENYLKFAQDLHPTWKLQVSVDPIDQAKDYIDAHYGSVITLESLARIVGMSRSSFAEQFKQKTGQTMGECLLLRRLDKAKELLAQSEWTISTISEHVGFRSPSHFHHLFRRFEQSSPLEYRNSRHK